MEHVTAWSLIAGFTFLLAAFTQRALRPVPISMPVLSLLLGLAIGPLGLDLLHLDLVENSETVETLTEISVLISLLAAGLKLLPSLSHLRQAAIPLASVTMVLTIALIALVGYCVIGLPLGAAILLGAVLAPTDPVLASEVQIDDTEDTDRLRYALTAEAGLNDGAAFPFIMLGLGLLGLHEIGDSGWRWWTIDLAWATAAGLACGWLIGYLISRLAVHLRRRNGDASTPVASEELLTLGMIGISYGVALLIHSYGFLAVFAAGVATRRFADSDREDEHPEQLMCTVAGANEQFGQILEIAMVVLIGAISSVYVNIWQYGWIALVLFVVIRPAAVWVGLIGSPVTTIQKGLIGYFGIRGIGSLYYLTFAIGEGLDPEISKQLGSIVVTTVVLSLILHSSPASLLLNWYRQRRSATAARDG